jgi:hypothetical protein
MATITCNAALPGVQPKGYQTGMQVETFTTAATFSAAASDVVLCCKVPNGATLLDCAVRIHDKADTASVYNIFIAKVGDGSGTAVMQLATATVSSTGGAALIRPTNVFFPGTKLSLSDDAAVQYALVKVSKTSGTTTASVSMAGWVSWTMDEA